MAQSIQGAADHIVDDIDAYGRCSEPVIDEEAVDARPVPSSRHASSHPSGTSCWTAARPIRPWASVDTARPCSRATAGALLDELLSSDDVREVPLLELRTYDASLAC